MKNAAFVLACSLLLLGIRASRGEVEPYPLPPPATTDKPDPAPAPEEKPALEEAPTTNGEAAPEATPTPTATSAPVVSDSDDKADLDVAGTPARVAPGGKMRVTVWAKNRGASSWSSKNVRVVVRWVDFNSGTRRKWSYNWIKSVVAPMGQFRLPLDVAVPGKAGRYKVIYGLVRMPKGGMQAPAYDSSQDKWPGEFAAIAFAVNISTSDSPSP